MNIYKVLGIILTACAFAGCSNNQSTPAPNSTNAETTVATPAPSVAQTSTATNSVAGSPSDVFKAQNEARKKKDAATMKMNLSRTSLGLIEKDASARSITLDEWLTLDEEGGEEISSIQTRNEKIEATRRPSKSMPTAAKIGT